MFFVSQNLILTVWIVLPKRTSLCSLLFIYVAGAELYLDDGTVESQSMNGLADGCGQAVQLQQALRQLRRVDPPPRYFDADDKSAPGTDGRT